MSIGKRLIDLARAELNSLLEKAAREDESPSGWRDERGSDPSRMTDEELEAEIERRRRARAEVEDAVKHGARGPWTPPGQAPGEAWRPRRADRPPPRRTAAGDEAIRKAYAALEIPAGSDFETVRRAYRRLMRKYHPDLHGGTPDKQRVATDLAQRLTDAYKTLSRHLRV